MKPKVNHYIPIATKNNRVLGARCGVQDVCGVASGSAGAARQRHLNRNPLSKLQNSLRLVLLHPFPQAAAAAAAAGSEALIA